MIHEKEKEKKKFHMSFSLYLFRKKIRLQFNVQANACEHKNNIDQRKRTETDEEDFSMKIKHIDEHMVNK